MKQNNQPHIIALIACSKSKDGREGLLPAKERYTGQLFKAQLEYVKEVLEIPEDCTFVLSAKYLVVPLNRGVPYYDETLHGMKPEQIALWAGSVCAQIEEMTPPPSVVYTLAGKAYRQDLWTFYGTNFINPIPEGLGYSAQIKFMKEQIKCMHVKKYSWCVRCDGQVPATHVLKDITDKFVLAQCDYHAVGCCICGRTSHFSHSGNGYCLSHFPYGALTAVESGGKEGELV
jgi:hypothetical protein